MAKKWDNTKMKIVLLTDQETSEGSGKFKNKSKTYSNVAQDAREASVYEVGLAIASLQKYQLVNLQQVDTYLITE